MINGSGINRFAINAKGVTYLASGALLSIAQKVCIVASGALISIEQDVQLHTSASGALVSIEQNVQSIGSGVLISIEQQVYNAAVPSFFDKNDWDVVIALGGLNIPRDQIQDIEVTHSVNDDSRATIKLRPGSSTVNIYSYQGKSLIINARTGSTFKRIFTGIVDIPKLELIDESITLEGVTSRELSIRNSLVAHAAGIGYYSATVFGAINDIYQEVEDRLSTIPYDLDFDPSGNWTVTSWTPKATADFTLTDSDLYRDQQPTIRIESAKNVINKVSMTLNYAYQRLHQSTLNYVWDSGLSLCGIVNTSNTLPTREMVRSAAGGGGWKVQTVTFGNLWPSGWYRCGGSIVGWTNPVRTVSLYSTEATSSFGNYTASEPGTSSNLNSAFCLEASWTVRKRFTQNVQEIYTITVNSPQSQTLYGVKEANETLNVQANFDPTRWEDPALYETSFAGTKVGDSDNYYINMDTNNAEFSNAITTALNKARTDILASHRDTEASFTTFVNPDYQLSHTISLNTDRIVSKAKVKSITHKFTRDTEATSTVRLALYRSVGSSADSALTPPARPTFSAPEVSQTTISLGSVWGQDPSQAWAKTFSGYIGNKWITSGFYKTTFQESFVVDTPAIPASRRDQKNYAQSGSYNVAIPADTLTITFLDS